MRKLRWLMPSLLFAVLPSLAPAAQADWKLEKDKDGIQVYTRAVEGWSIHEIRGVTYVPAKLSSVVAVINDIAAQGELNEYVAEATVQNRESDARYQIYALTKMPWPVSNRDIVNQRSISQDPSSLVVTITDTAVDKASPPPRNGVVRIVKSKQVWTLVPDAKGGVNAQMQLLSDPNGPIPASLINSMSISTPFKTLGKLKALAQKPQYASARSAFIKEPAAAQ
jgi:hypothetical protein